jgi:hypothetical protein
MSRHPSSPQLSALGVQFPHHVAARRASTFDPSNIDPPLSHRQPSEASAASVASTVNCQLTESALEPHSNSSRFRDAASMLYSPFSIHHSLFTICSSPLPIYSRAPLARDIVPRCFSREQGGKKAVFDPHMWLPFPYDERVSPHMGVASFPKQPPFTRKNNGELETPSGVQSKIPRSGTAAPHPGSTTNRG